MNVLIADDDRFVVTALQQKIDWDALGIQKVYSAYNIRQAMKIFKEHPIDILISDIEMPQGSGLELLAWVRAEGYRVQTIYLTNFADFHYAQKAIELQSFEYYLKPIEFDKLELIVKKAIQKVKTTRQNEEIFKVGQYWKENEDKLLEHFWESYIKRNDPPLSTDRLQKQLKIQHIDYSVEDRFLPVIIDFYPYHIVEDDKITSVFESENNLRVKLKSIIHQTFEKDNIQLNGLLSLEPHQEQFLILFKLSDDTIENNEVWKNRCNVLIQVFQKQFKCDVQCFIGAVETLIHIKSSIRQLQEWRNENVYDRNQTYEYKNTDKINVKYIEPNLSILEDYLITENRDGIIHRCQHYLQQLVEKDEASHSVVSSLKLDITQLIYTHLKKKEILAHHLFQGKIFNFLQNQSMRSIEDFMNYIIYLVDVSLDYMNFTNSQQSVVYKICEYIDQHYHENITRALLASKLYLSPDYIARIFKKEMGTSLINYLIKKRIEVAKKLLAETEHPIHLISDKVGYGNYSYFTKIFKKETNYTPMDYRKTNQKYSNSK